MGDLPSKAANERDKLVKVSSTSPTDERADDDHAKSEHVLLPFNPRITFATTGEDSVLEDPNGWEKLERD